MAVYHGSKCKLCRREGNKLFLKGTRCLTDKCAFTRRSYSPGQHGNARLRRKSSNYGLQLREKQKVKRVYGVLERQFRHYFRIAAAARGMTGTILLQLLECRLDNVVYRLVYSSSRHHARQIVKHGLVRVNGKKVDIPSFLIKADDEITFKVKDKLTKSLKDTVELNKDRGVPEWLKVDHANLSGKVSRLPLRDDIDASIQEQLIVELYSK